MRRILTIAVVLVLTGLAYAGTGAIGARGSSIRVVKATLSVDADVDRLQTWINSRENIEIVSMAFSSDKVLILYRQ